MTGFFDSKPAKKTTVSDSTQTTKWDAPAWYLNATESNAGNALQDFANLSDDTADQRFAGFNTDQNSAFNLIRNSTGQYQNALQGSVNALQAAQQSAAAGGPTADQLKALMNPYTQNVINDQVAEQVRQNDIMNSKANTAAVNANAFGGSRSAIVQAQNNRNLGTSIQNITDSGLNTAYNNALSQYNQNINNQINTGNALNSAATTGQNLTNAQYNNLSTIGQQQQTLDQQKLDFNATNPLNVALQEQSFLNQIPVGNLYGTTTTKHDTTTETDQAAQGSLASQILGGLTSGASLFGGATGSSPMSFLSSFMPSAGGATGLSVNGAMDSGAGATASGADLLTAIAAMADGGLIQHNQILRNGKIVQRFEDGGGVYDPGTVMPVDPSILAQGGQDVGSSNPLMRYILDPLYGDLKGAGQDILASVNANVGQHEIAKDLYKQANDSRAVGWSGVDSDTKTAKKNALALLAAAASPRAVQAQEMANKGSPAAAAPSNPVAAAAQQQPDGPPMPDVQGQLDAADGSDQSFYGPNGPLSDAALGFNSNSTQITPDTGTTAAPTSDQDSTSPLSQLVNNSQLAAQSTVDNNPSTLQNIINNTNLPLLRAGLAMMGSTKNFAGSLAEGGNAFADEIEKQNAQKTAAAQAAVKNKIDLLNVGGKLYDADTNRLVAQNNAARNLANEQNNANKLKVEYYKAIRSGDYQKALAIHMQNQDKTASNAINASKVLQAPYLKILGDMTASPTQKAQASAELAKINEGLQKYANGSYNSNTTNTGVTDNESGSSDNTSDDSGDQPISMHDWNTDNQ